MDDRTGELPQGTVTFLFTDIEGSTGSPRRSADLAGSRGDASRPHAARSRQGRRGRREHGGRCFFIAFDQATSAIRGAVEMQRAIARQEWPGGVEIRVRMGLHTGDATWVATTTPASTSTAPPGSPGGSRRPDPDLGCDTRADPTGTGAAIRFRDLGEHRLKGLTRPERLQQVVADGLDELFPAPRTQTVTLDLPVLLTSFIGRDAEIAAARRLLDGGARLVTLTGPGGTGKTRLSIQLATEVAERYPDGVHFVDLSLLADPSMVAATVARALRLVERTDRAPLDLLRVYLRERAVLLVLDNFEQVAAGAPVVAELLRQAPRLTVIATSRGPLRISGEHELAVPPLGLPETTGRDDPGAADAATSPAVALFVDRATAARSDFRLTDANAAAIVAICARLDGLPLAIELAAARVRLLPPDAILTRLGQSLDLLDRGGRDLPARQQTLRGAIGWSHDLLEEPTRRLFARMSVFAGGARLDEIEAVCGPATTSGPTS